MSWWRWVLSVAVAVAVLVTVLSHMPFQLVEVVVEEKSEADERKRRRQARLHCGLTVARFAGVVALGSSAAWVLRGTPALATLAAVVIGLGGWGLTGALLRGMDGDDR
jgi:tetrahydromethanopterin S-methyltransferase subunit F